MSAATLPGPKRRKEYKIRYDEYGDVILPRGAEFVDGKIVRKRLNKASSMSEISSYVSTELLIQLAMFVKSKKLGFVFRGAEEQGYQCFPGKPGQVRKPDISFLRRDMSKFFLRDHGWTTDVPELIAEVLSPGDKIVNVNTRILDFLDAGTKLLWVIDPDNRTAEETRADGSKRLLRENDSLDGYDVLPGFKLPLASILPPKKA